MFSKTFPTMDADFSKISFQRTLRHINVDFLKKKLSRTFCHRNVDFLRKKLSRTFCLINVDLLKKICPKTNATISIDFYFFFFQRKEYSFKDLSTNGLRFFVENFLRTFWPINLDFLNKKLQGNLDS